MRGEPLTARGRASGPEQAEAEPRSAFVLRPEIRHYCLQPPFDPPERFPELSFLQATDPSNRVYAMVREVLQKLRLDAAHLQTPEWTPFRGLVDPGGTVVIKPNLVTHAHYRGREFLYSTIVHGSVLRPLVDYVRQAVGEGGKILIADNPVEGADFEVIMEFTGIGPMVRQLRAATHPRLDVLDLRPRVLRESHDGGFHHVSQAGDPLGYAAIDLGKDSLFAEFDQRDGIHYYTLADPAVDHLDPGFAGRSSTDAYHNSTTHRYLVSRTVLDADLIVNVAKMKCHCKSGVSLSLKNMIGVVYEKNCMPHHRPGMLPDGDAFPHYPAAHYVWARRSYARLRRSLRLHRWPGFRWLRNALQQNEILVGQHIEHGNWEGNDTIWRTILDLNRIVRYADSAGVMHDEPQRKMFCLIDGIISQQGDAPINGEAVPTSVLVAADNPVVADLLALRLMGIEQERIKAVARAGGVTRWSLIESNLEQSPGSDGDLPNLEFQLSKGWR